MTYRLHDVKVLVVDDMPPMLSLTKSILKIFGFTNVIGAVNGEDAFHEFTFGKPDIIITDWLKGPFTGLDLIEKIRKAPKSENPFVPVILMTGYTSRARVEQARDHGVTEFLMKPFSARDLYSRIVQVIEKPRQFVDSPNFFGPDRRRRKNVVYSGVGKRETDVSSELNEEMDLILKDLHESVKKL
ncbi:MAG: response regulator [Rhodospirillales bacterium]|nr:response regulator [Alphaproteobacteria bacterium]USO03589.1 MAG: response regulator [Rhodospirillales bacterium]